jgi:hypothetical protein
MHDIIGKHGKGLIDSEVVRTVSTSVYNMIVQASVIVAMNRPIISGENKGSGVMSGTVEIFSKIGLWRANSVRGKIA